MWLINMSCAVELHMEATLVRYQSLYTRCYLSVGRTMCFPIVTWMTHNCTNDVASMNSITIICILAMYVQLLLKINNLGK